MLLQRHLQEPYQGLCDKHKRKKEALSINKFIGNRPTEHTNRVISSWKPLVLLERPLVV